MIIARRSVLGGLAATLVGLKGTSRAASSPGPITLEAAATKLQLMPGPSTAALAYNEQVPGPLLRIKLGERLRVRLVNKLDQPTTLCWHGVRIANSMDGVAGLTQAAVLPGASFDYEFTPPDSGLFWYHPHVWPLSQAQIGRGLFGCLIVDEPDPPAVDNDLLVVVDDWALDAKAQIIGTAPGAGERCLAAPVGTLVTVGSAVAPEHLTCAPGARVRLRLLNACVARIAFVSLLGATPTVVAIDGQPSEPFRPAGGTVPVGPGARFEFIFDMPAGSSPPVSLVLRGGGAGSDRSLVEFAVAGKAAVVRTGAAKLPENPRLPVRIPLERSLKRNLAVAEAAPASRTGAAPPRPDWCWTLDGRGSDGFSGAPLFTVALGQAVTLAFENRTALAQAIHVHGHVFRVLHDLDDGWDPFWRDSVLVAPNRTKHIAFVADNPGRWALESVDLARQVSGLAGYFTVGAVRHQRG